jgi:hypothetical protein
MPAFGEITATANAATAIVTPAVAGAGTYVEVLPVTAPTSGGECFDESADGRLRYTCEGTQKFHCAATISYKGADASADDLGFSFGDNGTPSVGSIALDSANNANLESTALHAMLTLSQNEYVSIWTTNYTNTDDPAIHSLNIFCMSSSSM